MGGIKKGGPKQLVRFTFNDQEYEMEFRHKLFCMYYVRNNFHGTQAAIDAGYSEHTATSQASRLLARANICEYIEALKNDVAAALGISAVDIAREYKHVGFLDIRKLFGEDGRLKKITDLDYSTAAALASLDVLELFAGAGEDRGPIGNVTKIRTHSKLEALDKLAKMIGKDGITKVATVDTKGKDIPQKPGVNLITLDPNKLPTHVIEAIIQAYDQG